MPEYNLVDQGWLNGRPRSGKNITPVGVLDALRHAHELEGLVVDLPTQFPALLRQVLLPIVLDALGSPVDRSAWARRFEQGGFNDEEQRKLFGYLKEHRNGFDLFDPVRPFAQVAGLYTAKEETKGSALLVATAATGNNVPVFASRTEGDPLPLPPAEAAMWLLHTHCWDTAAIKTGAVGDPQMKAGKTTGNPTGPLGQLGVITPVGRTLYETLLLNIPIGVQDRIGVPQWRRTSDDPLSSAGPSWMTRTAYGVLDLWTWQSRRIRLIPDETDDGPRVTRVVVAAGDRLAAIPDWEPHTAWKIDKPAKGLKGRPPLRPLRHAPGKAIWRGLNALLAVESTASAAFQTSELLDQLAGLFEEELIGEDYPLQAETFGIVYGNQSAVVEDVLHDAIALPIAALRADSEAYALVLEVAGQAEELAKAVNNLSADLRRAVGSDPIPWDKGQRPGEQVLHALDPLVRRLLTGLREGSRDEDQLELGRLAWEELAYRTTLQVAEPLFAAVPASAFLGREAKDGNKASIYRLGTAEANFRRQLDRILSRAADARREQRLSVDAALTNGE